MEEMERPDEFWRKNLSQKVYEAVRLGKMEETGTGKYVYTNKDGVYLCAACKSRVFSSRDKVEDGSGYAAFRVVSEDDGQVSFARSYSAGGKENTHVICVSCRGQLGIVSGDMLRSSKDLEQGNHEHLVHVSSNAVVLKKGFTFKNYPFAYLLFLGILVFGGLFIWSWVGTSSRMAQYENIDDEMHLWIGNEEVFATTFFMDAVNPEEQSLVLGSEALFIVLSQKKEAPQLRLSNQPVDIVWLDKFYKVVLVEQKELSDTDHTLVSPEGAIFVLVTRKNQLPVQSLQKGTEMIFVDKTDLL